MQIELKPNQAIAYRNGATLESINAAKSVEFRLVNKSLVIFQGGKKVGKFLPGALAGEPFGSRFIAYVTIPKGEREIVFEAVGEPALFKELGRNIAIHNRTANYKSPLQLVFSTTVKESLLTSTKEANLRGFLNLFIVLSVITYSRLILVNLSTYKTLFVDSVRSPALHLRPRVLRRPLHLLPPRLRGLLRLRILY